MLSPGYLRNKNNIFNWRKNHPVEFAVIKTNQNRRYYEANKGKLKEYYRAKRAYQSEAKLFREILVSM